MSLIEILVLTGIITAFATFGLVLAWGDRQTRHLPPVPADAASKTQALQDDVKLAA